MISMSPRSRPLPKYGVRKEDGRLGNGYGGLTVGVDLRVRPPFPRVRYVGWSLSKGPVCLPFFPTLCPPSPLVYLLPDVPSLVRVSHNSKVVDPTDPCREPLISHDRPENPRGETGAVQKCAIPFTMCKLSPALPAGADFWYFPPCPLPDL